MMQQNSLISDDMRTAGYRLVSAFVCNWGTFQGWHEVRCNEQFSMLTGPSGAGKSTFADSIMVSLIAPGKQEFNWAGARKKDRTVESYFYGAWSSDGDNYRRSRPDGDHISVVMLHLRNSRRKRNCSLGCVFYKGNIHDSKVSAFYFLSSECFVQPVAFEGIEDELQGNPSLLKKRFRRDGIEVFDDFSKYRTEFYRLFGLNDKATALLARLMSSKEAPPIQELVREYALSCRDMGPEVEKLLTDFDARNTIYLETIRAGRKLELLQPLVALFGKVRQTRDRMESESHLNKNLDFWADCRVNEARETELQRLDSRIAADRIAQETVGREIDTLKEDIQRLKVEIEVNGGSLAEALKKEIALLKIQKAGQEKSDSRFHDHLARFTDERIKDHASFTALHAGLPGRAAVLEDELKNLNSKKSGYVVQQSEWLQKGKQLRHERQILENSAGCIDAQYVAVRNELASFLGVDNESLPFVGEIICVKDGDAEWEGAVERLLRDEAVNIIVPEELWDKAVGWLDEKHPQKKVTLRMAVKPGLSVRPKIVDNGILSRIAVNAKSPCHDWMWQELERDFNLVACEDLKELGQVGNGICKNGHIRRNGVTDILDGACIIGNKSKYRLGWNNAVKLASLRQEMAECHQKQEEVGKALANLEKRISICMGQCNAVDVVRNEYNEYSRIDWRSTTEELSRKEKEYAALIAADSKLQELKKQENVCSARLKSCESEYRKIQKELAANEHQRGKLEKVYNDTEQRIQAYRENGGDSNTFSELDARYHTANPDCPIDVDAYETPVKRFGSMLRKTCEKLRDQYQGELESYKISLRDFISGFQEYERELDVSLKSGFRLVALQEELQRDDLSRKKDDAEKTLYDVSCNRLAMLRGDIRDEARKIEESIRSVNKALKKLSLGGRYIAIAIKPVQDSEISEFNRTVSEITLDASSSRIDFARRIELVRHLVDRFRGREGAENQSDLAWRQKVTDARNRWTFGLEERDCETDEVVESFNQFITGKSGGQKDRLTNTLTVACIALRMGVLDSERHLDSFRLCIMDEAFFKQSAELVAYAMELYKQLGLQLVIITPHAQNTHARHFPQVHFFANSDGKSSRSITLDELTRLNETAGGEESLV